MRRDPSEVPPAHRGRPSLGARRELLLYVEDDDDNWEVAEYRLSESYDVIRAATAEEACQLVRARRDEIDLILMDIELRGSDLNGVELTELLRGNSLPSSKTVPAYARNLPPVSKPVIYVTAHGKRYTNVQLMLSGADKVIAKPVNFADLRNAVSELIQDRTSG
jgi:CheY-like chemotaxis protein